MIEYCINFQSDSDLLIECPVVSTKSAPNYSLFITKYSLWSSGQEFWLHIQRSGFDSRRYSIIWEVVGFERGPLSLVSTTEELLERNSSGFGLENRDYGRMNPHATSSIRKSWH
jgi:hypothetical protein